MNELRPSDGPWEAMITSDLTRVIQSATRLPILSGCAVDPHQNEVNVVRAAASLELLEGCQEALALCEGNGYSRAVQEKLRSAIAKATKNPRH